MIIPIERNTKIEKIRVEYLIKTHEYTVARHHERKSIKKKHSISHVVRVVSIHTNHINCPR